MNKLKKIYFPNLNGLRFIAAFLVIIHHIEQFKSLLGLENIWSNASILIIGKLGVILFFVLSGFLITYLLLMEEKNTNTISIRHFYIRRLLRIWPLYYLITILSLFVFPYIPFLELTNTLFTDEYSLIKIFLFIGFLPNLALILFSPVPYLSQSWSVGVEEQFYLIWPVLMKKAKNKIKLLYGVIIFYLVVKIGLYAFIKIIDSNTVLRIVYNFISSFSIDCMAIGGILAYYLFYQHKYLKFLFSKYTQYTCYLTLILFISLGIRISYFHYEFFAVLFGIIILNLASNKESIISLENKVFNYLGKISYGLYMFHPLAIVISLKALMLIGIDNGFLQYFISIIVTILISGFSYEYYESYFIRKKLKYSKILSGDNAK